MRYAVFVAGAFLAGCLCNSSSKGESQADQKPVILEPAPSKPVFAAPVEQAAEGTSVSITAVNRSRVAAKIDVTHGPLSALHIAGLDGSLGPLLLDDARMHCRCECRPGVRCPECEPPVDEYVAVATGEAHVFQWNGKVGRFRKEGKFDHCMETFPTPPGDYIIKLCSTGTDSCAVQEMKLPLEVPVEISLIDRKRAKMSCSRYSKENLNRVVKMALVRMELLRRGLDVSACRPTDAGCVNTKDRDELRPGNGCEIAVIPTNAWTEVVVITDEGAYSTFFDPDGVYVLKVNENPLRPIPGAE